MSDHLDHAFNHLPLLLPPALMSPSSSISLPLVGGLGITAYVNHAILLSSTGNLLNFTSVPTSILHRLRPFSCAGVSQKQITTFQNNIACLARRLI